MNSKNSIIAILVIFVLLFGITGTSCSQLKKVKSKIAGTVYVDGRPQAYGTVQAYKDGTLVAQERCGDSGHYTLPDLDPGTYTLVYLNARGAPIGGDTVVEVRMGRFETVDLELTVQGLPQ